MLSAMQAPQVVEEYLREEVLCNRIVKLTQSEACKLGIHCSPFGVIPKKHKPNKWRLIVDLSRVSDGIARDLCSISYLAMDDVVACIMRLGKESLIAKMDIKQAYCNVPIHRTAGNEMARPGVRGQGSAVWLAICTAYFHSSS